MSTIPQQSDIPWDVLEENPENDTLQLPSDDVKCAYKNGGGHFGR